MNRVAKQRNKTRQHRLANPANVKPFHPPSPLGRVEPRRGEGRAPIHHHSAPQPNDDFLPICNPRCQDPDMTIGTRFVIGHLIFVIGISEPSCEVTQQNVTTSSFQTAWFMIVSSSQHEPQTAPFFHPSPHPSSSRTYPTFSVSSVSLCFKLIPAFLAHSPANPPFALLRLCVSPSRQSPPTPTFSSFRTNPTSSVSSVFLCFKLLPAISGPQPREPPLRAFAPLREPIPAITTQPTPENPTATHQTSAPTLKLSPFSPLLLINGGAMD